MRFVQRNLFWRQETGVKISLGVEGPLAAVRFMDEPGPDNGGVGHRRWLLFPPQSEMGTGTIPSEFNQFAAQALWVISDFGPRPPAPSWVAWPPPGYVPYQVMPNVSKRWSFSFPGADFSQAKVEMEEAGTPVPLVLEPLEDGFGDPTLVWVPAGLPISPPAADRTFQIGVRDVRVDGQLRRFDYWVTIIDADPAPAVIPHLPPLTIHLAQDWQIVLEWPLTSPRRPCFTAEFCPSNLPPTPRQTGQR